MKQKALPPNTRVLWEYRTVAEGEKERSRYFVVKDNVILTGDDINDAQVAIDQYNQPYTAMEFKPIGATDSLMSPSKTKESVSPLSWLKSQIGTLHPREDFGGRALLIWDLVTINKRCKKLPPCL